MPPCLFHPCGNWKVQILSFLVATILFRKFWAGAGGRNREYGDLKDYGLCLSAGISYYFLTNRTQFQWRHSNNLWAANSHHCRDLTKITLKALKTIHENIVMSYLMTIYRETETHQSSQSHKNDFTILQCAYVQICAECMSYVKKRRSFQLNTSRVTRHSPLATESVVSGQWSVPTLSQCKVLTGTEKQTNCSLLPELPALAEST